MSRRFINPLFRGNHVQVCISEIGYYCLGDIQIHKCGGRWSFWVEIEMEMDQSDQAREYMVLMSLIDAPNDSSQKHVDLD